MSYEKGKKNDSTNEVRSWRRKCDRVLIPVIKCAWCLPTGAMTACGLPAHAERVGGQAVLRMSLHSVFTTLSRLPPPREDFSPHHVPAGCPVLCNPPSWLTPSGCSPLSRAEHLSCAFSCLVALLLREGKSLLYIHSKILPTVWVARTYLFDCF